MICRETDKAAGSVATMTCFIYSSCNLHGLDLISLVVSICVVIVLSLAGMYASHQTFWYQSQTTIVRYRQRT